MKTVWCVGFYHLRVFLRLALLCYTLCQACAIFIHPLPHDLYIALCCSLYYYLTVQTRNLRVKAVNETAYYPRTWSDLNPALSKSNPEPAESNLWLIAPACGVTDVVRMLQPSGESLAMSEVVTVESE